MGKDQAKVSESADNSKYKPLSKHTDDHSENAKKYSEGGFRKNLVGLIVLTLLYTIQGIPISFFKMSIPILLTEKGAHFKDLGILSIMSFPYSLKFFVAPILDAFYIKSFGQRKSYIVPIQYLYVAVSFALCYHLKEYIDNFDIKMIFILGLACILLVAIQDVAVDGWALTILTEDYLSFGPTTQTIGILLGHLVSFNVFIPLNSARFCNNYVFSTPQEEPLLTVGGFWYLNAIFVLAVTVLVHFFIKEKKLSSEENASFGSVISTVTLFYKNPNLRLLSIVCLTQFIGSMPIAAFFDTVLIKKGFHKETLANINTFLAPVEVATSIFIGKICKRNQELKVYMVGCGLAISKAFFQLFIIWIYSPETNFSLIILLLVIAYTAASIQRQVSMIAISSFCNKMSNESVGTTFISTRAALGNFGVTWVRSVSLVLGEYMPWYIISAGASIFGVFYFFWFKRVMEVLSTKKKHEFYTVKKEKE